MSSNAITQSYAFIGCTFGTYALFEHECNLLFLDFHAAHERRIFDMFVHHPHPQTLAVPVPVVLSTSQENNNALIPSYKAIGIHIEVAKDTATASHYITAVPAILHKTIEALVDIIQNTDTVEGLDVKLFSQKACKRAVKAGDHIDSYGAYSLLSYSLQLESPRCPHGRPLWVTITKPSLDSMIGRI